MQQKIRRLHAPPHRWREPMRTPSLVRTFVLCAIGMAVLASTACGELEPMVEPEIVDLQLTLDTLKTQVRDAQRNLAEVRAELESRRQELADAQVARAQLDGRVREAERRVVEARHVIELQREELIAARVERERVFRSSSHLQSQMKQLQKRAPKAVNPSDVEQGGAIEPTGGLLPSSPKAVAIPRAAASVNAQLANVSAMPAAVRQPPYIGGVAVNQPQKTPARHILVKRGDTLWSLARKYRIGLNRLRSINYLTDDQIEVGQILLLSENRSLPDLPAELNP